MRTQCLICGVYFNRISSTHLAMHGTTPQEYSEKYGAVNMRASDFRQIGGEALVHAITEMEPEKVSAILSDPRVFDAKMRQSITDASVQLMGKCLEQYSSNSAELVKLVDDLRRQLIAGMNEDGSPMSVRDKVAIAGLLQTSMRDSLLFMTRLLSTMTQDNRSVASKPLGTQNLPFSAVEDRLPNLPETVTPFQREKIRQVLEAMDKSKMLGVTPEEMAAKMKEEEDDGEK